MAGKKDPRDDRPNPKNRATAACPPRHSRLQWLTTGRGLRSAPLAGDGRNDKSVPRVSRADGDGVRVRLAGGAVIVALRALSVRPGASGTQGRICLHRVAVRVRARALSLRTGGCEQQRACEN
jgi:hypothetical protein